MNYSAANPVKDPTCQLSESLRSVSCDHMHHSPVMLLGSHPCRAQGVPRRERAEVLIPMGKGIAGSQEAEASAHTLLFAQLLSSPTFPEALLHLCVLNVLLYLRNNDARPADNLCPISARCRAALRYSCAQSRRCYESSAVIKL